MGFLVALHAEEDEEEEEEWHRREGLLAPPGACMERGKRGGAALCGRIRVGGSLGSVLAPPLRDGIVVAAAAVP